MLTPAVVAIRLAEYLAIVRHGEIFALRETIAIATKCAIGCGEHKLLATRVGINAKDRVARIATNLNPMLYNL